MVRNIVGTLIEIGRDKVAEVTALRGRRGCQGTVPGERGVSGGAPCDKNRNHGIMIIMTIEERLAAIEEQTAALPDVQAAMKALKDAVTASGYTEGRHEAI